MTQVHHPVSIEVVVAAFRHALDHEHDGLTPEQHFVQTLLEAIGEAPPAAAEHEENGAMRFLLGGEPDHEFTGDPLPLLDSLHELLNCHVGFGRNAPSGVRWVEDPNHPAGGYEQRKPVTITIEVTGARLGPDVVRAAILSELARLGHGDVTVQLDT